MALPSCMPVNGSRKRRKAGFRDVRGKDRAVMAELFNLQEVAGEAKPYQIRQFMRLIERYNVTLEKTP